MRAAAHCSVSLIPISVHARRRVGPWLIASVICTAAGCTLIDDGFEPALVDANGTSDSTAAAAPSPLKIGSPSGQESMLATASSDDGEVASEVRTGPARASVPDTDGSGTTDA